MTVHLASVGLSVLRALELPGEKITANDQVASRVQAAKAHLLLASEGIENNDSGKARASEWAEAAIAGGDSGPATTLRDVAAVIRPQDWPRHMCAELDTFARLQAGNRFTLSRKDIAVLICSDTPDGLLAGVWNAVAIADGDLGRLLYVPELAGRFAHDVEENLRGSVVLARVAGMDAGDDGFRDAMRGLGFLARRLFSSGILHKDDDFTFNLSGGFKAAIPYLIAMAEAVRSVDDACLRDMGVPELARGDEPWPVTAWVQHETAGESAPPIRLPLRRVIAESARQEVSGYDASGKRTDQLGSTLLEGYAFDTRKRYGKPFYKLTPFGEGLAVFLGTSPERAGG